MACHFVLELITYSVLKGRPFRLCIQTMSISALNSNSGNLHEKLEKPWRRLRTVRQFCDSDAFGLKNVLKNFVKTPFEYHSYDFNLSEKTSDWRKFRQKVPIKEDVGFGNGKCFLQWWIPFWQFTNRNPSSKRLFPCFRSEALKLKLLKPFKKNPWKTN